MTSYQIDILAVKKLASGLPCELYYFRQMIKRVSLPILVFLLLAGCISCDKNEVAPNDPTKISGTGNYTFTGYLPFATKPIDCFYHIPSASNSATPILILLPGAARDADAMRDGLVAKANQKGFIVLALRFSETYYPGADVYNLANIFDDGDNPSASTQNPEEEWTFSVIDPIFLDFKKLIGNNVSQYDLFGHSAGAQLAHRYLILQPNTNINRAVCSASGWYMMPDKAVDFPYGLKISPAQNANLGPVFSRVTFVIVGANDTDPNSFNLRHTPEADAQGNNRLERAQYFYQGSLGIATQAANAFNWQYKTVPNTGHDGNAMANFAADFLY
jgi:pimeloyl-ACP methyl ester carboxylesterase